MALVLANGTLASLRPLRIERAHLGIEGGRIAWAAQELPEGAGEVVDCRGRLLMPGNVCAHTHLYSALARGMPPPVRIPRNFPEILELVWWRLDRALDEQGVRYSGLVGALDAVRSGTTTVVDHHASPSFIDGSLDVLADALGEVGLRAVLCYEVTDRGGVERRRAGLRENARFLRENQRETVAGMVGAHAGFTLDDAGLADVAALADEHVTGVHIHLAEDVCDQDDAVRRSGLSATERLDRAGILRQRSIVAHGVHLADAELSTIQGRRSWLVHNCRSNMNNHVGRARVGAFGERSALGTDGIDEDMFEESRTAFFRWREAEGDVGAERCTELLARGAELAGGFFPAPLGRLEPGAAADIMLLAYDPPTPLTAANLAWHWMFGMSAAQVESVMVNGAWVVRGGECCKVDEEKIRWEARQEASRLWERMASL